MRVLSSSRLEPARASDMAGSRWGCAAGYALAWFPAAALGLYLKHAFLQKEYLVIARAVGRDVETDITALEARRHGAPAAAPDEPAVRLIAESRRRARREHEGERRAARAGSGR